MGMIIILHVGRESYTKMTPFSPHKNRKDQASPNFQRTIIGGVEMNHSPGKF
jgi:hypothetical protein